MKSLLALVFLVCCAVYGDAASLPATAPPRKHCSLPLDNSATWNDLMAVATHAQAEDKKHTSRIIPKMPEKAFKETESCCLNANILDYYLRNVLTDALPTEQHHTRLPVVKHALHRVRRDLEANANCTVDKYDTHEFIRKFRKNFVAAGEDSALKAVGEMDILFHYLYESCGKDRC